MLYVINEQLSEQCNIDNDKGYKAARDEAAEVEHHRIEEAQ